MSSSEKRIPLAVAGAIAEEWLGALRPLCIRADIAGSIRREKPDVGDIEIVAVPDPRRAFEIMHWLPDAVGSFLTRDEAVQVKRAGPKGRGLLKEFGLRLAGQLHMPLLVWGAYPGRYLQIALEKDICLDLFLPAPEAWALIYMIRTGSAEFSAAMAGRSKHLGYIWEDGLVYKRRYDAEKQKDVPEGPFFPLTTEEAVFEFFGVRWVEPRARTDRGALEAAVSGAGA